MRAFTPLELLGNYRAVLRVLDVFVLLFLHGLVDMAYPPPPPRIGGVWLATPRDIVSLAGGVMPLRASDAVRYALGLNPESF